MSKCAAIVVIVAGSALALASQVWKWQKQCARLQAKLIEAENSLETLEKQRVAERTGRIRAQQALRKNLTSKHISQSAFPMTPIGYIRSCYSTRNGTPRQPLLVTLAKSCVTLTKGFVSPTALDGLEQFSHCWLIYVFHENTDLHNLWKDPSHRDFKAKIRVPRLDGQKLGIFATRSPHRPCPIGLTVAKVERIDGANIHLSGADLVDGTPILDIKPYLPYCDSISDASVPSWVNAGDDNDPIAIATVRFSATFLHDLSNCWETMARRSLYENVHELQALIKQVLSRDIRSLNQRMNPHNGVLSEVAAPGYGLATADDGPVLYHVILEGIKVSYVVDDQGVLVKTAFASRSQEPPLVDIQAADVQST